MDGDDLVGEARRSPFDDSKKPLGDGGARPSLPTHREHVGRKVMNVEDEAGAQHSRDQAGDDQEVRRVVNLNDSIAAPKHEGRRRTACEGGEADVLRDHSDEAGATPMSQREPQDVCAVDGLALGLAGPPHRNDVHLVPGSDCRRDFSRNPRLAHRIGPVYDHAESTPHHGALAT
jgi:hypothetical protein